MQQTDAPIVAPVATYSSDDAHRAGDARIWAWRLAAWTVGFTVALWIALQWGSGGTARNDFTQNVWLPSRLLLDGANPYYPERAQVDLALGARASDFSGFNSGAKYHSIYPVWVAVIFAPFALLPVMISLAIWRAGNLLLLVWGLVRLLRISNPTFKSLRVEAVSAIGLTLLMSVIFRETVVTLYAGQFSIIEFGILAAIWGHLVASNGKGERKRLAGDILVGVGLAVLATKPQAVGLPVLLLGLWALSRRRWAIPAATAATLAFLLLTPLLFFPSSISDWLSIVAGGQAASQMRVSASVWGISYHLLPGFIPWIPVAVVLSLLGLALLVPAWRRDFRDRASPLPLALPLTICVNSVVSPYMLGYEQVLLLLPAMVFLAAAGLSSEQRDATSRRWRLFVYFWLAVLPLAIVVVQTYVDAEYILAIQSFIMLAFCWAANCGIAITAKAPRSRFFLRQLESVQPQHQGQSASWAFQVPQSEGGTLGITS